MSTTISTTTGVVMSKSSGDNEPAHYLLKVEGFSRLSEGGIDKYESDTFESGNYKWKLVLYPKGNTIDEGDNHISLYLRIVETESLPKGWEVNVYFKFYLYDHVRENYITFQDVEGKKRRFHSAKLEWGFGKVLPLKIFKDTSSGYLFQDTCVFGVEVFVIPKFVIKENCFSMIKLPASNKSYTWTIHNFSSLVEKISEDFKVGNIKWKLELYPKGNGTGSGSHLSLYLSVADYTLLPINWRIYAKYNFRVKDQSGTDHTEKEDKPSWPHLRLQDLTFRKSYVSFDFSVSATGDWFCSKSSSWGFPTFISLSDLKDNGKSYVVDDKLIVEVEFAAVGVNKSFLN